MHKQMKHALRFVYGDMENVSSSTNGNELATE